MKLNFRIKKDIMKSQHSLILSVSLLLSIPGFAQTNISRSVIASGGQAFQNSQIQLSATVGEFMVTTLSTENLVLTQGFQQAEKEDFTSSYQSPDLIETLKSFPNPASQRIYVDIMTKKKDDYHIEIFDVLGKRWKSRRSVDLDPGIERRLQFDLNDVPDGHYFIRIVDSRGQLAGSLRFLVQK
jgi:hypothetical protein